MITMKDAAKQAAKEFKAGRGRAWLWVTNHADIIDAECMDQLRTANYTGGTMTWDQVEEFRTAFILEIAKRGFRNAHRAWLS